MLSKIDYELKEKLARDEAKYIEETLGRCLEGGHLYYVHSRDISEWVRKLLKGQGLYNYTEKGEYTYVCREDDKEEAFLQMPEA